MGTLNFVASEDLGDLGSDLNRANEFTWHWYYSAPAMLPWLILVLALILPKANRHIKAWQILIPVLNIYILWKIILWAIEKNAPPSNSTQQFEMLILSLCLATAILWLLSHTRSTQTGIIRFLRAVGILAVIGSVSILCFQGTTNQESAMFLVIVTLLELSFVFSMVWARRLCKQTYKPVAFMFRLLPCTVVVGIVGIFVAQIIMFTIIIQSPPSLTEMLLSSLMGGSILAVMLYVINLPFLILAAIAPFYGERFQRYLNLKPRSLQSDTPQDDARDACDLE
jgi:hypothetical protein